MQPPPAKVTKHNENIILCEVFPPPCKTIQKAADNDIVDMGCAKLRSNTRNEHLKHGTSHLNSMCISWASHSARTDCSPRRLQLRGTKPLIPPEFPVPVQASCSSAQRLHNSDVVLHYSMFVSDVDPDPEKAKHANKKQAGTNKQAQASASKHKHAQARKQSKQSKQDKQGKQSKRSEQSKHKQAKQSKQSQQAKQAKQSEQADHLSKKDIASDDTNIFRPIKKIKTFDFARKSFRHQPASL